MRNQKNILVILITTFVLVFSGCNGGNSSNDVSSSSSLSGLAQKGPFLLDSSVTLCELDEKMICTENLIETKVTDNDGSYSFPLLSWSGLSKLTITGKYFDEVTGLDSTLPVTINAIIDIESNIKNSKNVNIFTDMRSKRMKILVDEMKSLEDASLESKEDVKKLFNIHSDDFTELNLTDFSTGKASVNAELLRISAAVSKSTDPINDLETLMEIYNQGGLAAILESTLYKKLMDDAEAVDLTDTLSTLGVESEIPISDIKLAAFARASFYSNNQIQVRLFGTSFNSSTPSITVSNNESLAIEGMQVAEDNKSVILTMNTSTSCKDIVLSLTLDYMTLTDVVNPIQTNEMIFSDPMTICNDGEDTSTVITVPINKFPIAIIGTEYTNENQDEQYMSVDEGEVITEIHASYSHDRDAYPFGGIAHCQWKNELDVVIKESNDNACDLSNVVFENGGTYDYTLTVTDKVGAKDSNVMHITVNEIVIPNEIPTITITPSTTQVITLADTITLNAIASDLDERDTLSIQWRYQKAGTPSINSMGTESVFNYQFTEVGEYKVFAIVTDSKNASAEASVIVTVEEVIVPINNAPTISISPSEDNTIVLGQVLKLDAIASDLDVDDTVKLEWKYQKVGIKTINDAGIGTKFTYTFTETGRYKVFAVVTDSKNASAEASVTITVEKALVPINNGPTVSISPAGDKTITLGESVILKSSSLDVDGDDLVTSWKVKNITASEFIAVPNFGATGFNHKFDALGTYLVVVEVTDTSMDKAEASITVTVEATPLVVTLEDINLTVLVKGNDATVNNGDDRVAEITTNPLHGTVEAYLVGNEVPYVKYTSTDCFIGVDSFIYKSGEEYGRVNITITDPSSLNVLNETRTLYNIDVLTGEYLRAKSASENVEITTATQGGSSSLTIVGNEVINYNYDPDDTFVGNDYFTYTVSETINECSYSKEGRIDFKVEAKVEAPHLFSWWDETHGYELWKTDGTVAGTSMLKDINVGTENSGAGSGVVINGIHYFAANDGIHSTELWESNGTESGTRLLKDINTGENDGSFPYRITLIGETMYFFGMNGDNNGSNWLGSKGIYKSDGTELGTVLVEDFGDYSLSSYGAPGYLKAFGDKLIFAKDDAGGGGYQWEPWISDGSNAAYKIKDIWPGDEGSSFIGCVEMNSKCYASADDYYHGSELWVTDGTNSGTYMVKDIYKDDGTSRGIAGGASNLTVVGNQLFFVANSLSNGYSLWKSDGTSSGTVMVHDYFSDDTGTSYTHQSNYNSFTDVNGVLYFEFNDEVSGKEVWKSDGTKAGTVILKDIASGYSSAEYLMEFNGKLYFWFTDDTTPLNSGLYESDGTSEGTVLIKAFSQNDYYLSGNGITQDNGKLYIELMNNSNANTYEYWISDATAAGTFKLVDGESYGEGEF